MLYPNTPLPLSGMMRFVSQHSSFSVGDDLFSDPERLRRRRWYSSDTYGLPLLLSDFHCRHFKTINPSPMHLRLGPLVHRSPSLTTNYAITHCTGLVVSHPSIQESTVDPDDDPHLRSSVEHHTHTYWAHEPRDEPVGSAATRFLFVDSLSPPPDDIMSCIPCSHRPLLSEVLTLAAKTQLHTTGNGTALFVHRPPTPTPCLADQGALTHLPLRIYIPMLMRP